MDVQWGGWAWAGTPHDEPVPVSYHFQVSDSGEGQLLPFLTELRMLSPSPGAGKLKKDPRGARGPKDGGCPTPTRWAGRWLWWCLVPWTHLPVWEENSCGFTPTVQSSCSYAHSEKGVPGTAVAAQLNWSNANPRHYAILLQVAALASLEFSTLFSGIHFSFQYRNWLKENKHLQKVKRNGLFWLYGICF